MRAPLTRRNGAQVSRDYFSVRLRGAARYVIHRRRDYVYCVETED
jgi:hypothetical protein